MKIKLHRRIIKGCLIFLLLFSSNSTLYCIEKSNIKFSNLNEKFGLSLRETNSICSDLNGFIWISSKMGVTRYSPNDIRSYKLPYENVNVITTRLSFSNGQLYVYSSNGQVFLYNTIKDRFEIILNLSKTLRNPYLTMSGLLIDKQKRLWLSTTLGLFCFSEGNGLKSLAPKEYIHKMIWYNEDQLLLAIEGNELVLFNINDFTFNTFFKLSDKKRYSVSSLYFDKELGNVWIGTMKGIYVLKIGKKKEMIHMSDIPNQPIMAIEKSIGYKLLIGIDGQGVWEIDRKNFNIGSVMKEDVDNPNSLKGNGVYDIYLAPDNRVWVCTYSGGVSFFDKNDSGLVKISHVVKDRNSLINNDVNAVLEDSAGNLWFATNNGISKYSTITKQWKSFYSNKHEHAQVFMSLCEDDKGRIWAGTYSSGVYILDSHSGMELAHYSEKLKGEEFTSDFVFNILKDGIGDIWIGDVRGSLVHYITKSGKMNSYSDVDMAVMRIYDEEHLLIGGSQGVSIFNKQTGEFKNILDGYLVVDIYLKDNYLWICTTGEGILKYNIQDNSLVKFTEDNGLPSNYTNSIEYIDGYFWVGTENGICRLKERDGTIQIFNHIQEFNNVSFNSDAHCLLKNGNLLFGTNKGALLFNPKTIEPENVSGEIFFQDISINGSSLRESQDKQMSLPIDSIKSLSLKYYQNNFSFELLPIRTTIPDVKFSWKLEGLNRKWSKPANSKILTYSNVASGTYELKIRMYDYALTNVICERNLLLNITPPYWATWWFKLTITVLIIGIVIIVFLYYISQLKKRHSEDKIRFFSNTAHDIRTSLTLINAPIEELKSERGLSSKGENYVNIASDQSRRLANIVTRLMDFQKVDVGKENLNLSKVDIVRFLESRVMMFFASAKRRNLEIIFNSGVKECNTLIDEVIVEKIIDNLLSNAIKYSFENTKIIVELVCTDKNWILKIVDKGIGIDRRAQKQLFKEYYRGENAINSKIVGSGIGLLLVKNYVLLHDGTINCESQTNIGTTFTITIPINIKSEVEEKHLIAKQNDLEFAVVSDVVVDKNEASRKKDSGMKIVIVDDNDYLRDFLSVAMGDHYQVFLADNGEVGWDLVIKHSPDLVVSDVMMPVMNGYDLCKRIKSTYDTSHIPVILLTALSAKDQQLEGLGLGADDYLTKPFDVKILHQRIESIIQNREKIRDRALKIIKHHDKDESLFSNELNDEFLKRMVDTVRTNIGNSDFSKDDFAAAMNVSPSLLYKKVKSLTNQSPTDFIKVIRLEHSLELIRSKKYTITEISELCGFSTVGYFSTVFRKHYGNAPSQIE